MTPMYTVNTVARCSTQIIYMTVVYTVYCTILHAHYLYTVVCTENYTVHKSSLHCTFTILYTYYLYTEIHFSLDYTLRYAVCTLCIQCTV